ncbi:MAG: DUF2336 domain-containing protein, partial [Alphaproteobacteria bacterium]|nr:DUF2336 domain-containing protein [Alphaproteobacteria bacterium]
PEILYFLAEDDDQDVRREAAANPAMPRQADLLLVDDVDDDVRLELARKIGRLAPELSPTKQDQLQKLTLEALEALGNDTLPTVRQVIAEEIKRLDNVPKSLVKKLARDVVLIVAAPILEYSPLLNDTDLLEIINSEPIQGALSAISRRLGLPEPVVDAIAAAQDSEAIAELLANSSAQIREETLDSLIDGAEDHEDWHEPLVLRPHLTQRAIRRIARFVTVALLKIMEDRHDLDESLSREIAQRVKERIEGSDSGATREVEAEAEAESEAKTLYDQDALDETVVAKRIADGDKLFVTQAVALLAELSVPEVNKVLKSRNAKGVTALSWQAGLSMRTALELQTKVAQIESRSLLYAKDGIDYPMDEEEMRWRLELFLE